MNFQSFLFKPKEPPKQVKKVVRLDLAWRELKEINDKLVEQYAAKVTELDLSNNKLSDISPLIKFTELEILVLDGNRLTDHSKIPRMEKLHTLWVNKNKISNLTFFIDKLVEFTPNLKFLSMLDNDACPNYFNGGSLKQYNDYRYYVLSRLRNLTTLDHSTVSPEEKQEAVKIYGNLAQKVAKEEKEAQRIKELKEQKKELRLKRRKEILERRQKKQEAKLKKKQEEAIQKLQLPSPDSFRPLTSAPPPPPVKDPEDWTSSEEEDEDEESDWSSEDEY